MSHVPYKIISPELLEAAAGWAPRYFVGLAAAALRAGRGGRSIGDLRGWILEGWRVSDTPGALTYDSRAAATPIYRQANIGHLRLLPSEQHWSPPRIAGRWCARPDDVVLNKLVPVRAAFVSPNARRHPVDGNALIIRGLTTSAAVWVALCLNHPGYEQLLLVESGVLKRVGLGALEALRVPPVPPEMDGLAARVRDILDDATLVSEALHRTREEANAATTTTSRTEHDLAGGSFFARDAVSNESWLPSATALRAEQSALEEDSGWVALDELASFDDRTRLCHAPDGARVLRLSDVGDDLLAPSAADAHASELIPSRTLAKPLVAGDVLLSTLGTSFRAAYADEDMPPNTHPVDGWVRLRFRETPAAWALLLTTAALRSQAARLTVGSAQQFVPPDALRSLRVPAPSRDVRDRWQRAIEQHHAQRRSLDRRWSSLMNELAALFDAVHAPFMPSPVRMKEALR
ncbi:hypothetical protein D9623_00340 [Azospirillum brasilense]|uniref:Restriction endonuclease subunit S n=1 Tax=Azospirillum brasilense TaxID=192 RepID=A0A0P0F1B2_AZOBR|nr:MULTISPECIES: hypothetical protein [Azospirillum]ALJ34266.1 hypothetical protein AMK58_01870 [Azospirillum brasilense]MDW7552745.1 hypothetical protein [Azospirillum brasilense]MDW7592063.1 hypothetical protein [Azospirillum brasilense]MDW7627660.1 hypothetical protein [Azospirillum brasilense]MDX5952871.1 hypothetical protein [Azospirillum brasilense]